MGRRVREMDLGRVGGVGGVARERGGGSLVSPGPEERLKKEDELFVFGEKGQLDLAEEFFRNAGVSEA